MTTAYLETDLLRDEGYREKAYWDSKRNLTIGVGHMLPPGTSVNLKWSKDQILAQLRADIEIACDRLDAAIPWWRTLDDTRQDVLANMCFNMGWLSADGKHGLGTFKNTLAMVKSGDYEGAAVGMLASQWAVDVGNRSARLADLMRHGVRP